MKARGALVLIAWAAAWTWSSSVAAAEVVYVTDELRLGLFTGEQTSGRPVRTLTSGARLTVLERSLMSIRVRTEEGDEGWVKTAYVVNDEPARRRVAGLEQQLETTATSLAARDAEVNALTESLATVQASLEEAERNIADLPGLTAENEALRQALEARGVVIPLMWFGVGLAVAVLVGVGAGYWWLDRRVRKQFSGIRVY